MGGDISGRASGWPPRGRVAGRSAGELIPALRTSCTRPRYFLGRWREGGRGEGGRGRGGGEVVARGPSTDSYPPESLSTVYSEVDLGPRRKRMTHYGPVTGIPGLLAMFWVRRKKHVPLLLIPLHILQFLFHIQFSPRQPTHQHPSDAVSYSSSFPSPSPPSIPRLLVFAFGSPASRLRLPASPSRSLSPLLYLPFSASPS